MALAQVGERALQERADWKKGKCSSGSSGSVYFEAEEKTKSQPSERKLLSVKD
jgi:hypothetical protein